MKKAITPVLLIIVLTLLSSAPVMAAGEKWLIRSTAIHANTDAKSGALNLDLDNDTAIAVDGTYFFTPNIGVNVLATFLDFEVTSNGNTLGAVEDLPPIFTLQYHFAPEAAVRPYIGLGFNYNIFSGESGTLTTLGAEVENTIGYVAQVGLDYMLTKNLSLNLDLKYLTFDADIEINNAKADELEVDAVIAGIGLGYRF